MMCLLPDLYKTIRCSSYMAKDVVCYSAIQYKQIYRVRFACFSAKPLYVNLTKILTMLKDDLKITVDCLFSKCELNVDFKDY